MNRFFAFFQLMITGIVAFGQAESLNCRVFDTMSSAIPENIIKLVTCDQNDNVWFVTGDCFFGGKLVKYDGNNFSTFDSANSPIRDKFLTSIFVDHENQLWVGSRTSGLFIYSNGKWIQMTKNNSELPDNHIMDIIEDMNHDIWIATENGLAKIHGNEWKVYTQNNSPLPDKSVNSICVDKNNILWLGTNLGFASLSDEQWKVYNTSNSKLPNNQINFVSSDNLGRTWIIYWWGLVLIDGDKWTIYNEENFKIQSYAIFKVYHCENSDWYATSYGIVVNKGDDWKIFNPLNSCVPSFFINAMSLDSKNRKWFATNDGLLLINN